MSELFLVVDIILPNKSIEDTRSGPYKSDTQLLSEFVAKHLIKSGNEQADNVKEAKIYRKKDDGTTVAVGEINLLINDIVYY